MFTIFLIALVIVLIIVLPIIILVSVINFFRKGEKDSQKFAENIRAIYIHMILVMFLCMTIGSFLGVFGNALNYFLPEEEFEENVVGQNDKNQIAIDVWTSIAGVAIAAPMFIYHSKEAKKIKTKKKEVEVELTN